MAANPQTTLPPCPRDPFIDSNSKSISVRWLFWLGQIQRILSFTSGIAWGIVDKAGSRLADIETRWHSMLQRVYGADPTDTGVVIEDAAHVKHVSDAQAKRWEDGSSVAFQVQAELLMTPPAEEPKNQPSYIGLDLMGGF